MSKEQEGAKQKLWGAFKATALIDVSPSTFLGIYSSELGTFPLKMVSLNGMFGFGVWASVPMPPLLFAFSLSLYILERWYHKPL